MPEKEIKKPGPDGKKDGIPSLEPLSPLDSIPSQDPIPSQDTILSQDPIPSQKEKKVDLGPPLKFHSDGRPMIAYDDEGPSELEGDLEDRVIPGVKQNKKEIITAIANLATTSPTARQFNELKRRVDHYHPSS